MVSVLIGRKRGDDPGLRRQGRDAWSPGLADRDGRPEHGHAAVRTTRARRLHRRPARRRTRRQEAQQAAAPASSATCPGSRTLREFRVDDVADYEVGQTIALADMFERATSSTSAASRRARASPVTSSATTSTAAPRPTAPTITARPARSVRHHAGSRLQGPAHGRPHGRRAGHGEEGARRPRRRRAQPALVKGACPAPAAAVDPGQEGLTDAARPTLYDRTGSIGRAASSCTTSCSARAVNEAVLHQVVVAQLANRRARARTTPRPAARSAAAARSRTARRAPAAPARARVTAPHYRGGGVVFGPHPRSYEQHLPRKMKRLALRGALTAKLGDEAIRRSSTRSASRRPRPRTSPACSRALNATGRVLVVAAVGATRSSRLSARNLPTVEVILADSLNVVDLLKADTVAHRAAVPRPHGGGLRYERAHRARDHPAARRHREVDRRSRRRGKYIFEVHPDANKIQIKAAVEEPSRRT